MPRGLQRRFFGERRSDHHGFSVNVSFVTQRDVGVLGAQPPGAVGGWNHRKPWQPNARAIPHTITKVAFADGKACALQATNELYCWGNNIKWWAW